MPQKSQMDKMTIWLDLYTIAKGIYLRVWCIAFLIRKFAQCVRKLSNACYVLFERAKDSSYVT